MPVQRVDAPARLKTVVIDDDPTGTQSASGVGVLFGWSREVLLQALLAADSVYVLSNSRAEDETTATGIVREIRDAVADIADELGCPVRIVLRGDSTLRGHVFAEAGQLMTADGVILFVPAFPAGGRTTVDGVHYVRIDGTDAPANTTEFADDPVFGFSSGTLADYVREKSAYHPVPIELARVRSDGTAAVLSSAPAGSVVLPDVVSDSDIAAIAAAVEQVGQDRNLVVRAGAPLAAALAGVVSVGTYAPVNRVPNATLLVCGSHTGASSAQLAEVERIWGPALVLDTEAALADPQAAGRELAGRARAGLASSSLVAIASERERRDDHGTLDHGRMIMDALVACVRLLMREIDLVVSKGGITSAEVARAGIGADSAEVRGQILAGVSVWGLTDRTGRELDMIVVPGNVGSAQTLVEVLDIYGVPRS